MQPTLMAGSRARFFAYRLDPVALSGEGIGRQRDAPRSGIAVQPLPVERQALYPKLQKLAVFALRNPGLDGPRHVLVIGEDRKRLLLAPDLATVKLLDPALIRQIAPQLRGELRHRARHRTKPELHRLPAHL